MNRPFNPKQKKYNYSRQSSSGGKSTQSRSESNSSLLAYHQERRSRFSSYDIQQNLYKLYNIVYITIYIFKMTLFVISN